MQSTSVVYTYKKCGKKKKRCNMFTVPAPNTYSHLARIFLNVLGGGELLFFFHYNSFSVFSLDARRQFTLKEINNL